METETLGDFNEAAGQLRRFITSEVLPFERDQGLTWRIVPPRELRKEVRLRSRQAGFYAPDMPLAVGGGALSFIGRCALEMELHSHDTVFFEDVIGGGCGPTTILLAGTPEQQRRYLAPLVSGEWTTCFALSEPDAGSDANSLKTTATIDEGGYRLNGTKNIVSNGPQADFAIVFAVVKDAIENPGSASCFLVDASSDGYRVGRDHTCMGFTGFQGELVFDDCRVSVDSLLGLPGKGFALAMDWINGNRVRTAAMATGIARGLLRRSTTFSLQRVQFGSPIASFQAIQLKLADMATELAAAESLVERAARAKGRGEDTRKLSAMTKLFCAEMVNRHAYEAVQVHGGAGCLEETGVERIYRMVRILTILEGTSEMQRLTIAERVLKEAMR
jgi:acyl-CoA dehydrogenase